MEVVERRRSLPYPRDDQAPERPEALKSRLQGVAHAYASLARGSLLATSIGMTTSTTMDHPPETKADATIEPPIAPRVKPELAVPPASSESDLESRIKLRRAELIGKLGEIRAEASLDVVQAGDKLKARLSELAHIITEGVVDGWASLGDRVKHKLECWLSESERERSLAMQDLPTKTG
jgi:hypothetical protein